MTFAICDLQFAIGGSDFKSKIANLKSKMVSISNLQFAIEDPDLFFKSQIANLKSQMENWQSKWRRG